MLAVGISPYFFLFHNSKTMLRTFKQQIIRDEQRSGYRNNHRRRQFNHIVLTAGGNSFCKLPPGVRMCPICHQRLRGFPIQKCPLGHVFEDEDKMSCIPAEYMGAFWSYVEKHEIIEDNVFNKNIPTLVTLWKKQEHRSILKQQIHGLIRLTCHEYGWWGPLRWLASMDIDSWQQKMEDVQIGKVWWTNELKNMKTFVSEAQRLVRGIKQGEKEYKLNPPAPEYHVGAAKILSLEQVTQVRDFIEKEVDMAGNLNSEKYAEAIEGIHGNQTDYGKLDKQVYEQYYENAQLYFYIQHFKLRQQENDDSSFSFIDDDKEEIPTCIGISCADGNILKITQIELAKYLLKLIEFLLTYFHKMVYLNTSKPWTENIKTKLGESLHQTLNDLKIVVS
jgi:hypothetical protein